MKCTNKDCKYNGKVSPAMIEYTGNTMCAGCNLNPKIDKPIKEPKGFGIGIARS